MFRVRRCVTIGLFTMLYTIRSGCGPWDRLGRSPHLVSRRYLGCCGARQGDAHLEARSAWSRRLPGDRRGDIDARPWVDREDEEDHEGAWLEREPKLPPRGSWPWAARGLGDTERCGVRGVRGVRGAEGRQVEAGPWWWCRGGRPSVVLSREGLGCRTRSAELDHLLTMRGIIW